MTRHPPGALQEDRGRGTVWALRDRRMGIRCLRMLIILMVGAWPSWVMPPDPASAGQTVRVAVAAGPVSQDPHVQLSAEMLQYAHLVFDPLVRWTADMRFEPRLAVRWERVSPTALRFHLRRDVRFHSGNAFSAEDVKWTLDRLRESEDYAGLFEPLASARIIDEHTIDLTTEKPYALVLNMAAFIFPMDPGFYWGVDGKGRYRDAIAKVGPSFALSHASGTGRYRVTTWNPGAGAIFEAVPDYWDKASPGNVDKVVLTPIRSDAARVDALLSGKADLIMPVSGDDFERIDADERCRRVTVTGTRLITLQLNQKRREAFRDPRVRQAMVWAVDNAGIVEKIMKGAATPAGQQGPKGFLGHQPNLVPRFDLDKARSLMKAAGYADGFACTMIAPSDRYVNDAEVAEAVTAMLAKINLTVDLETMPKIHYWDRFDARAADIQMIGWRPETEDSANYTEALLMCPDSTAGHGRYNSGNYCNTKVDELILAARMETVNARRRAMLREVEQLLYDDAAFIPLYWQNISWAGKKDLGIEAAVSRQGVIYLGDLVVR